MLKYFEKWPVFTNTCQYHKKDLSDFQDIYHVCLNVLHPMSDLSLTGQTVSPAPWMYYAHITSDRKKRSGQLAMPVSFLQMSANTGSEPLAVN